MAIIKQIGSLNGVVSFELSFDNSTMKLSSVRVENTAKTKVMVEIDGQGHTLSKETTEDRDVRLITTKQWNYETVTKNGVEKQVITGIPWSIRRGVE